MEGKSRVLVVMAICVFVLFALPVWADVHYVNAARPDDSGNGLTWDTAKKTINAALSSTSSGDEVWVAASTTGYSISNAVPDGVSLYGGFAGTESNRDDRNWVTNLTVISSGSVSATTSSGDITIDGFKLTGLSGIVLTGDVTFSHNSVINCDNIDPVISCVGTVTLSNNLIHDNNGYKIRREPTNTITCGSGTTIINNTITGNGYWGGDNPGAAIACSGAPIVVNNIFTGQSGCFIRASSSGTPVVSHNCRGSNPFLGYNGFPAGWQPDSDIQADPLFVNSSADNFHLQSTSPCIDAGDDNAVESGWVDLDLNDRQIDILSVSGSLVDIGAYEYIDTTPPTLGTLTCPEYIFNYASVSYSGVIDTESGVKEVSLWYKYGANGTWTYYDTNHSSSSSGYFDVYLFDGYGTYYFALTASDNAGNYSGDPTAQTVAAGSSESEEYDTHAPSSLGTLAPSSLGTLTCPATANSPFIVSYDGVTDTQSGIYSVSLWYKYGAGGTWTRYATNADYYGSGQFTFTPSSGNGTYYFALSAEDNAGNHTAEPPTAAAGSTDFALTATITKASEQRDPAGAPPINYTVTFSEPVTGFSEAGVILSGANYARVTGSGTTYNVAVVGMPESCDVTVSVAANAAQDAAGNPNTAGTGCTVAYTDIDIIWRTRVADGACYNHMGYAPTIAINSLDQILAVGYSNRYTNLRRKYSTEDGSLVCSYDDILDYACVAKASYSENFYTVSNQGYLAQVNSVIGSNDYESAWTGDFNYIAVDEQGKVYVTWQNNGYHMRIFSSDDLLQHEDVDLAIQDHLFSPYITGIAVDQSGSVFIAHAEQYDLDNDLSVDLVKTYVTKYWKEQGNWTHWNSPCYASSLLAGYGLDSTSHGPSPMVVSESGDIYIAYSHWNFGIPEISYSAISKIDGDTGAVLDNVVFSTSNVNGGIFDIALYNDQGVEKLYVAGTATEDVGYPHSIPITSNAYQPTMSSYYNAFIAVLDGDTLDVDYCSYFGQTMSGSDSVAVDSSGGVYIGFGTDATSVFPGWDGGGYICKLKIPDPE